VDTLRRALDDERSPHQGLAQSNTWWDRTCQEFHDRFDRQQLAARVLSIEYFPYPSAVFKHEALRLPSQAYTFDLVRTCLGRGAFCILTRGAHLWFGAVPELHAQLGTAVFRTRNAQNAAISPGNLPDGLFGRLCDVI
jgi:hypothetical protein